MFVPDFVARARPCTPCTILDLAPAAVVVLAGFSFPFLSLVAIPVLVLVVVVAIAAIVAVVPLVAVVFVLAELLMSRFICVLAVGSYLLRMHWDVFPGTIHQGRIEDHAQPLQTSSCLKLSLFDFLFRLRSLSWPMFGSSIFFVVSRYFWQLLLQTSWSWRWMMGYDGFAGISSRIWEWVNTYGTTSQLCWWQMLEDGRVHTFFGHSLLSHRYLQLQNSAITQKARFPWLWSLVGL